jgi:hypothetical protein
MKEALQSAFIIVLWVAFWLGGTLGDAVLQAWLIDLGGFVRYRSAVDHYDRFQLHRLLRWCIRRSQTGRFGTETEMKISSEAERLRHWVCAIVTQVRAITASAAEVRDCLESAPGPLAGRTGGNAHVPCC